MCSSPFTIPNPYYGLGKDIHTDVGTLKLSRSLNWLHNTTDTKITVPCGRCQQCVSMRQAFVLQRVQMESLRSHLFYFTLTYNNRSLKRTNIGQYKVAYPYYEDVWKMFKRMRNDGHIFRYWIVSEYGTSEEYTHRPHYHGILAVPIDDPNDKYEFRRKELFWSRYMLSQWKRNVAAPVWSKKKQCYRANTRSPVWQNLLDYKSVWKNGRWHRTYDFHYIEPLLDHDNDVSFYVSKYILQFDERVTKLLQKIKLDPSLSSEETDELISCIKPRSIMSKDFGSPDYQPIKDYIMSCITKNDLLPQYYDLYTGQSSLLSRYYRKLIPMNWFMERFMKYSELDHSFLLADDNLNVDYNNQTEQDLNKNIKFEKIKNNLRNKFLHCT